jgi:superfamily II DNA helicase RecQ
VQDDIVTSLDMRLDRLYRVVHSFNRVNLFYEVRYTRPDFQEKLNDITSFINGLYKRKQRRDTDLTVEEARSICGIIYCRAKQTCDMVAEALRRKGINAAPYHRGMKDADSERNSDMWRNAEALAKDGKKRVDCIGRYDQFDIEGILIARSSRDGSIWVSTQRPFCDRQ